MRWAVLVALALAWGAAAAEPRPYPLKLPAPPKLPPADQVPVGDLSPAGQLRACALDLSTRVAERDRPYTRYSSLYIAPAELLPRWAVAQAVILNTASQGPDIAVPEPVPGTGGRLWRLDLRRYRWTRSAFSAVARRDPTFRDVSLPIRESEYLRRTIGLPQDPETLAAEVIVDGLFLMRHILQPEGFSSTYYDLLYAEQRFGVEYGTAGVPALPPDPGPEPVKPGPRPWPGGTWPGDNRPYPAGSFQFIPRDEQDRYELELTAWRAARALRQGAAAGVPRPGPPGKLLRDFPADLKDWEAFWGIDKSIALAAERRFVVARGEVVAGARNHPKGSYVAYNDRAYEVLTVPTGKALSTFDSDETAREFDYIENPLGVVNRKIKRKAGEHLTNLPNGLQAALLTDQADKRIDKADTRLARNTLDPHEVTVLTQIGCLTCHAPAGGYIAPTNRKLREGIEAGLKLKVYDREQQEAVSAFFLGWEELESGIRTPYQIALRKATANRLDPKDKGWTGDQLVSVLLEFRDWYDRPIDLATAARQLGVSPSLAFMALTGSPSYGLNAIALGRGMPRAAWDATGAKEAFLLVELFRVPHSILMGGWHDP